MGYNRSGVRRTKRLKRNRKHMAQLERKYAKQEQVQTPAPQK